jgi:ABC-type uncharacterized transport system substrate-binding protein
MGVLVLECSRPEDLLGVLERFKSVDFVWCLPDRSLYNSTTLEPLVRASLRYRLPLIGFSESFVRSGAALGVYPDFADIGGQAGEVARDSVQGKAVPAEVALRKPAIAVNAEIMRMMGLRPANLDSGVAVLQ